MSVSYIGKAILSRRKALKITQPQLSEMAQISVNSLYKIEKGQSNPSIELLEKIAAVLGMELKLEVKKLNP